MVSEPQLERAIGPWRATAMVVGTIIGASIFVQPAEVTGRVASATGVFAVWIVAGALTLCGALVCAWLASRFTRTGGVYVYLSETCSPAVGFLWGWSMFWTVHSGIIAVVAVVCARYVAYFAPLGEGGQTAVAVAVIAVLSAVNWVGVRSGSALQTSFTLAKVVAIAGIVVLGFALGGSAVAESAAAGGAGGAEQGTGDRAGPGDFLAAVAAGLFAFGGWHMVTYNAEETIEPRRTIPRALVLGTVSVTLCYVALNAVYLRILPLSTVASSERVAADAADALLGSGGGALMSALVVFSTFGALSGIVLAGPRVYWAMARDGLLFRWFGTVHPRFKTPHRAIALQAVWSSVLVATGTYRELFTRVVYTEWAFFGLMAVGLVVLARRERRAGDRTLAGHPVVALLFAAAAFGIAASQVVERPGPRIAGLGLVLAGLPVFYLWCRRRARGPAARTSAAERPAAERSAP